MSKLIAIVYPDMNTAKDAFSTLKQLQKEYIVNLEDAAYITKDKHNKINLQQSMGTTGAGASGGAIWGALIGLLFLAPVAGAIIGGSIGALAGKASDYGIDDKFMKELANEMKPGSSALFMLGDSQAPDKLKEVMAQYGGTIITSSLPKDAQEKIQKELDSMYNKNVHASARA